ncbi:flagellar biosynthesis, assembly of basal-body periplasmic P ring [Buchnera aphidicola (Nipponaphis monzeni)]|uniref:Flagella basal body P-ring formation protein FlgA n=1 Tax=Buchnera aphidicola (Nipponaphis monzeni) TaxID=2495405 RepID=A0A455TA93_9GAMM|nr:flagellar basal body P-ring formation chaperone FlgA [Buchnera aphidicola]BBI01267.1 flagellar biosynthesis, assembly of basal-body periplasmic P ring [Buchnera aphidicola (Nipponaphis monzeni)]
MLQVNATSLFDNIFQYLKERNINYSHNMHLIVYTQAKKWNLCEKPKILILNNSNKNWGLMELLIDCHVLHRYLKVELQLIGKYITVTKTIPKNTLLSINHLRFKMGRLDLLPKNTCVKMSDILNKVTLKEIKPNEPITFNLIKSVWLINYNTIVPIIINGEGFQIESTGKALNNAQSGQKVRILIYNKILIGESDVDGKVIINVK